MADLFLSSGEATLADAVYGEAVGDALGVPFEFLNRGTFEVTGMKGYGTHYQPAGTYSDDSCMMLAICDSIRELGRIDTVDLLARFRDWINNGAYAIDGDVFDYGIATSTALRRGYGMTGERDNGNGSLMRTAPLAFFDATDDEIRAVSAITHATQTACDLCVEFVHLLRRVREDAAAVHEELRAQYGGVPESEIKSSGYVVHTLNASKWCFANTDTYRDCVALAVSLGDDSDTTGAVAGALAGTAYGIRAIPADWMETLRGKDIIESCLF